MKIVVCTPLNSLTKDLQTFGEGISYLKKLGHNVTVDFEIKEKNPYKKIEKAIKDTDIVLTEISNADSKVGFEIARAIDEKKIVIALHNSSKINLPFIEESVSKSVITAQYDKKNITEVLDKAVNEAKSKLDTKFILIISPEIDRYLDWAAQTKRMHKAQIVRNSIEEVIRKDKDYKNYLAG